MQNGTIQSQTNLELKFKSTVFLIILALYSIIWEIVELGTRFGAPLNYSITWVILFLGCLVRLGRAS